MNDHKRCTALAAAVFGLLILAGCASTEEMINEDRDPFRSYNRFMFTVNDKLDKAVIKPTAQAYRAVLPEFVRQRVTHFFGNLGDFSVVANDLLQLKLQQATVDASRIVYNTTFGLLGLFDVASDMGLHKHNEDFGQTLGYWGVGEGYYLVLPLLGPSTTRDVWNVPVDSYLLDPITYVDPLALRLSLSGTNLIDRRANLLRVERAFEETQIDPYSFQRQAYLQRRRDLVYDGNPPKPKLEVPEDESTEPSPPPPQ